MHFFNPVHIMKLLELVVHEGTSEEVIATIQSFGETIGKEVITVRDFPGFASSRLGVCLGMEAIRMVEQGVASPEDIDKAMEVGYRHPMGPSSSRTSWASTCVFTSENTLHAHSTTPPSNPLNSCGTWSRPANLARKQARAFTPGKTP